MSEFWQRIKHILYRQKTSLLHFSSPARWIRSKIWQHPHPGTVKVLYRKEQDIRHYFDWRDPDDDIAKSKLREFTERYAAEPDIVYEVRGDLVIEPEFGLAIQEGRRYIHESGTLSHLHLRPPLFRYLRQKYLHRRYTEVDYFVHCDGFAGLNLCHFIYDTLNPILFLYQQGMISEGDPILISEKVYQKPYFQYFLEHSFMGKLNWLRQKDNEWIRVRRFKKAFVSMEIFRATTALFPRITAGNRKIFLGRKPSYQRRVLNLDALMPVLQQFGFEIVFAEDLTYAEQVALFRNVRYFIGIHGAGLTNLLHSNIASLRVLEIFSSSMVHASFYRFLKILDVEYYDAIAGTALDVNWNFSVDEKVFAEKLRRLMQS
jgi:hypothetical protein